MDENFVPTTLEECFAAFDAMMTPEAIEEFKNLPEGDCTCGHFGIGMWCRNNWGLWSGGPLQDWFNARNVWHADDMSGIIFTSYWRRLNRKPIDLDSQVKYYDDYWKAHGIDVKEQALAYRNQKDEA